MKKSMSKKEATVKICVLALMTALCFVGNYLSVPVATIGGSTTRIHFGNVFCLLSGLLLGPIGGGLAAGLGAFLYDLTNPLYIAEAPITFVLKFAMGAICGAIAHSCSRKGHSLTWNLVGGISGALSYVVLYLTKGFIMDVFVKSLEVGTAMLNLYTKAIVSSINGIIAVAVAVPLAFAIRKALSASHLDTALFK